MNFLVSGRRILQRVKMNFASPAKLLLPVGQNHFNLVLACGVKTKQAAAKRIIRTGSGKLKHAHSGKSHLTGKKSRTVTMRLNQKAYFSGQMFKNMNKLIAR